VKRFVNCRAYAFDQSARAYRVCDELLVDGPVIAGIGSGLAGATVETVDLEGAIVAPAFADCHVHLIETGLSTGPSDLGDVRDAAAFAARVAALPDDGLVFGAHYDDSCWRDGASALAEPLEQAFPDRLAMLIRIDGHSSLVNRRTLSELALEPTLEGLERDANGSPTGRLFLAANWAARARFNALIPAQRQRAAATAALELALSRGAVHVHAQLGGLGSREAYAGMLEMLRGLGRVKLHPKILERDPAMARQLGLPYVGGDVFLDGSLGSGTAALRAPYCDRPGNGQLSLDDDAVHAYFAQADRLGVAAGVHAIGDRAIEQCLSAWERVARAGGGALRARHFIEHFELAAPEQIARAARLGLFLSMQPQFDAQWGGESGMYALRLGAERARGMNDLAAALAAGATLCGGDDSPVCALAPLEGMAAACAHHNPAARLTPLQALTMYAYDAARFGYAETTTGALAAGLDADFVVLDRDPFAAGAFADTQVLETWVRGELAYARAF
jgi:predicted amidohydrolase YtcJ